MNNLQADHTKGETSIEGIVAIDAGRGIGKNGKIPWNLPADMKFFKDLTAGACVIMGRKTYESIPPQNRPLSGRINIVISKTKGVCELGGGLSDERSRMEKKLPPGTQLFVVRDLDSAIICARLTERRIFIAGGGAVYAEAIRRRLIDVIHVTRLLATFGCDILLDSLAGYEIDFSSPIKIDNGISFQFEKWIPATGEESRKK